jgi:hypothetical protein
MSDHDCRCLSMPDSAIFSPQMPTNNNGPKDIFDSWKEIAAYLGRDVRTCTRWEHDFALPIRRIGERKRARVFAFKKEIDDWRANNGRLLTLPRSDLPPRFKKILPFIPAIGIAILFFIFFPVFRLTTPQPTGFLIEKSKLVIIDAKGKKLWDFDTQLENLWDEHLYRDRFQIRAKSRETGQYCLPMLMINDINNDGNKEVLFSPQPLTEIGGGDIICFDHKGEILWAHSTGRPIRYGKRPFSSDFVLAGFVLYDIDNDSHFETICISHAVGDYPTQLTLYNSKGKLVGEFWNAGQFVDLICIDLDKDGDLELLVAGTNNEYGKGCLVVFDHDRVKGGSPQEKIDFVCQDLNPGEEKYYILFPRTELDRVLNEREVVQNLESLKNDQFRLIAQVSSLIYYLDYSMFPTAVLSDGFKLRSREFFRQGKILDEIGDDYKSLLEREILFFNGKKWINLPTENIVLQ